MYDKKKYLSSSECIKRIKLSVLRLHLRYLRLSNDLLSK